MSPNLIDKSLQMSFEQVEIKQEPTQLKNMHKYVQDMKLALKHRSNQEKLKLKNMLKKRRISDKTYKKEKQIIEKWVEAESKQISNTKNILIQGWMQANEIIGHLEKDKDQVYKRIDSIRGRQSPKSEMSEGFSTLSFWRSDNSFGTINASAISHHNSSKFNWTADYDVCNNLRRRNRSRHNHLKLELKQRSNQKIPVTTESNIIKTSQKSIEKLINNEDKSESLNWNKSDGHTPSDRIHDHDEGYIDKCVQDIKEFYKEKGQVPDKSDSSKSSSFHMGDTANNDIGTFNTLNIYRERSFT